MRELTYAVRERRGSRVAAVPLTVLAAVFFIPTYQGCQETELRSPAHYVLTEGFWILPVFAFAAVLAALTLRALARGEMDAPTRRLGLAAVVGMAAAQLGFGLSWTFRASFEWPWFAAPLAATAVGAVLVRSARGMRPWQIWEHLLASFVLLAAVSGPTVFLVPALFQGGHRSPGVWLYSGSLAALVWILGAALVRARRETRWPRLVVSPSSSACRSSPEE